jgi:hypothetical protein
MSTSTRYLAAAVMVAAFPLLSAPASAGPLASSLALKDAVSNPVETVQYRRGWGGYRGGWGYRGGAGIGLGIAAGALLGGAIIASQGYPYAPGYAYGPGYGYAPGYAYGPGYAAGGDAIAYCQQRFRSYDPRSGTYLGYDGLRHPCP